MKESPSTICSRAEQRILNLAECIGLIEGLATGPVPERDLGEVKAEQLAYQMMAFRMTLEGIARELAEVAYSSDSPIPTDSSAPAEDTDVGVDADDGDEDDGRNESQGKELFGWQGSAVVELMDITEALDDLRAKIRLFEGFTQNGVKEITLDSLGLSLSLSDWTQTLEQLHERTNKLSDRIREMEAPVLGLGRRFEQRAV